jgi:hypothetical protein
MSINRTFKQTSPKGLEKTTYQNQENHNQHQQNQNVKEEDNLHNIATKELLRTLDGRTHNEQGNQNLQQSIQHKVVKTCEECGIKFNREIGISKRFNSITRFNMINNGPHIMVMDNIIETKSHYGR